MKTFFAKLDDRRVVTVSGEDAVPFLQGLVTNDVSLASQNNAVFAALLTAQGKFLHDFFIVPDEEGLLLDTEANLVDDLKRRLSLYKLRSKVTIEVAPANIAVWAIWGAGARIDADRNFALADPRLADLGCRLISKTDQVQALQSLGYEEASVADYDHWRLSHGVPSGSKDLVREKSALLESNYDALNAISWEKGCYMGQELTARTRYRGLVKRRLAKISFDGDTLPHATSITLNDVQIGEVRSTAQGIGLASVRLDTLSSNPAAIFFAGGNELKAKLPKYLEN